MFAAASLTEALTAEKRPLATRLPAVSVSYAFAGSQALARQIIQGAPADVFAAADERSMRTLAGAHLVEAPRVLARNRLAIAVAPGNPKGVHGLADLGRRDLAVVLADPSVPAGDYARQALTRAGVAVDPRSLELDVKAALAKVVSGDADAAVVYETDVRAAGARVGGIDIPDAQNVVATYPVAVVTTSHNRVAARAVVEELLVGTGQGILREEGFLGPSEGS